MIVDMRERIVRLLEGSSRLGHERGWERREIKRGKERGQGWWTKRGSGAEPVRRQGAIERIANNG